MKIKDQGNANPKDFIARCDSLHRYIARDKTRPPHEPSSLFHACECAHRLISLRENFREARMCGFRFATGNRAQIRAPLNKTANPLDRYQKRRANAINVGMCRWPRGEGGGLKLRSGYRSEFRRQQARIGRMFPAVLTNAKENGMPHARCEKALLIFVQKTANRCAEGSV